MFTSRFAFLSRGFLLPRAGARCHSGWVAVVAGTALALFFAGCAVDAPTFLSYSHATNGTEAGDLMSAPAVSDGLAINYANSVEAVMRAKFNGNRIAREVSSTAQVGLAAFGGAAAAFEYSAGTVAALGLGSAGIPELQRIFNAKGRAEVYKDAAQLIHRGVLEFYSLNPRPSSTELTPNGLILVQRVSGALDMVDDVLAGRMPSQLGMLEATEAMTPEGTKPQRPGNVPVNKISANPSASAQLRKTAPAVVERALPRLDTTATPTEFSARRRVLGGMVVVMRKQGNSRRALDVLTAGGVSATESGAIGRLGDTVDNISTEAELQRWEKSFGVASSVIIKTPPAILPGAIEALSPITEPKPAPGVPKTAPVEIKDASKINPL